MKVEFDCDVNYPDDNEVEITDNQVLLTMQWSYDMSDVLSDIGLEGFEVEDAGHAWADGETVSFSIDLSKEEDV